ncbi:MAG: protein-L-isoaspartate(D-aspartate) O-methyltransferase [Elusimicrobiota bacterium]
MKIIKIMSFLIVLFVIGCMDASEPEAPHADNRYAVKRNHMVEYQIKDRGIENKRVLEAMRKVPRHKFVSPGYESMAYSDRPLPIGEGQTISQPYIVGLMTELAKPKKDDKMLEIGTGSGYQAAVLSLLCKKVYTIEIIKSLADTAGQRLESLGCKNTFIKHGDGFKGWPDKAPFDCIIVTAAPPEIPTPLIKQLKDGGRMVIPVGPQWRWQDLFLIKKENGEIIKEKIAPVRFVPMTGNGVKDLENEHKEQ